VLDDGQGDDRGQGRAEGRAPDDDRDR